MHPSQGVARADIIAMLQEGHSNGRIARDLHCNKPRVAAIRAELGLPNYVPASQTRTIEEKWALYARPVDGGHMEWTGERAKGNRTPLLSYKGKHHSAAAVAFRIRTGADPDGYAFADCGLKHCIAPDHVQDEAGRQQARREARAARGLGDVPAECVSGHDQAEHAKFEPDGTAYCGLCKILDKRAQHDPTVTRQTRRPASMEEAFARHAKPADDGHVQWTGSMSHTTPTVWCGTTTYSAYKIAFRLHHGRDPEGVVTSSCDMPGCVAGAHVEDRPMRQRRQQEEQRAARREMQLDRLYADIFGEAA
ncbi:hypothetical protein [Streptomyces sp. ME18-1-4]|uniref:hypothetical protein n=1 Tax=Streptomyces sp. ME18-1-4 TaxID=3028685 RepID=UPI0029AADC2F|nr:hypothetical protein [Streptomyces sp. ME18-1-4]MDX3248820.1 hypothetical protein [Streptomyces sp. ME18-1-4]